MYLYYCWTVKKKKKFIRFQEVSADTVSDRDTVQLNTASIVQREGEDMCASGSRGAGRNFHRAVSTFHVCVCVCEKWFIS